MVPRLFRGLVFNCVDEYFYFYANPVLVCGLVVVVTDSSTEIGFRRLMRLNSWESNHIWRNVSLQKQQNPAKAGFVKHARKDSNPQPPDP